jgi:hypothetical protein
VFVCVFVFVCMCSECSTHSMVTIFRSRSSDGHVTHILSRFFLAPGTCVWRRLCLALPSSLSRFLLLVERLHGKMPRMSIQTFPTRPRLCFRPFEAYSKVRLCVFCHVCLYRWHPQFTARTARCLFLPAQPH